MTHRVTALAIHEAAQAGDIDTLMALLAQHEEFLAGLTLDEAREACELLEKAEHELRGQMTGVQKELGGMRKKGRGLKQYKSAA
jgi:hypothetical protein